MITLALDASTYVGDVAVLDDARLLAEASVPMRGAEHEGLMPAIVSTLAAADIDVDQLERVLCGAGPGSFTSLRIAGAIAKGIACGVGIPLYAVSSLALIVGGAELAPGRFLAANDALRGEVYVGLYEVASGGQIIELEPARLASAHDLEEIAADYGATAIGPLGAAVVRRASPRAHAVARLSDLVSVKGPVDMTTWEPAYGRLAEAQVRWESTHGKPLPAG